MKNNKIILFTIITVAMVAVLPAIIFSPSICDFYNFSSDDKANIGTVISSILSPTITLVSVVLLYITLNEQIKNNKSQQFKNDFEIIALEYNQFDREFSNLVYSRTLNESEVQNAGKKEIIKNGSEAFEYICTLISLKPENFNIGSGSGKILSILNSFKLTYQLIQKSQNIDTKQLFEERLRYFYELKMRDSLKKICLKINLLENKGKAQNVLDFYFEIERRFYDPKFDIHKL